MSDCKHVWQTEHEPVRHCSKCEEYEINILHAEIAELKRQLSERRTLRDEQEEKIRFKVAAVYSAHVNSPMVGAYIDGYRAALEAGEDG